MSDQTRLGLFIGAFFAAAGVVTAFLPLWFADRGLSPAEIGQVLGLASLLRVIAVPAWGHAADTVGQRPLLLAAAAVAALAAGLLPGAHGFGAILLIVAVQGVAAAALTPLADTLTLALAGLGRLEYGRTRAFGSVTYMGATALAGPLLQWAGTAVVPVLVSAGYALAAIQAALLPAVPAVRRHAALPLGVGLFSRPGFGAVMLASALVQGSHAAYYAFATLHWRHAGLSDTAIGLLIAEGIVAEIALFIWGRPLVERLGPAGLTALASGLAVLRWTGLALTTAPAALIALQLLHAGTFAFQHLATMQVLARSVPPARAATAQALMSALGFSAPTGLLIWLSGRLYGQVGGLTFLAMAAVAGAALAVVPALARAVPAHLGRSSA